MKERNRYLSPAGFWLGLVLLFVAGMIPSVFAQAAETKLNTPLDPEDPVYFYGSTVQYGGQTITLDANNIYIDGTLSDEVCATHDHVYNDFKKAYNDGAIKSGTDSQPMNVWLAPYVYWIDNPDEDVIREGINNDPIPYGLWMDCNYLSLNGLTSQPENVVLAVNRGQNAGAKGNFTMFYINGTGTHTENLTMGNYCCVDLDYPLKQELSRPKRTSTITQSQLCLTNGNKITADNCNFVSRLNSCPFAGGNRILFTDCHFECTDDSLPNSAIFLHCDFDFYSSRPFYNTSGSGSVMLDCIFNIKHKSNQYLTKFGGTVTIIDSTFYSTKKDQYIGWTPDPANSLRCYAGNITVQYDYETEDGTKKQEIKEKYKMDPNQPYVNVDITDTKAMEAYRFTYNGETIYNVYNLFKGTDSYDPLNQKSTLEAAKIQSGTDYTDLPVALSCDHSSWTIDHGDTKTFSAELKGFSSSTSATKKITWSVEDRLKNNITLKDNGDGTCDLTCKNETKTAVQGMVWAKDESGLVDGVYVTAAPETQPAPTFVSAPKLDLAKNGIMSLKYTLPDSNLLADMSEISWYRCSDAKGTDRILVAVTQNDKPLKNYTLGYGDIGYYIQADIVPKQQNTYAGTLVTVVSSRAVTKADVTASPYTLKTDFSDFAYTAQSLIKPDLWIRDIKDLPGRDGWVYGNGVVGYGDEGCQGLMPVEVAAIEDGKSKTVRRSRLLYVPPAGTYGDMDVTWVVNPEKTAGQGFGSAGQYMDLFIKMNAATMTGYALRVERVKETGRGVQLSFVKYTGWDKVEYIGNKVLTSAFNATCTIRIALKGTALSAEVTTTHSQSEEQAKENLLHTVNMNTTVSTNTFGGLGIYYTGSCPEGNRVMFSKLNANWDKNGAKLSNPEPPVQPPKKTNDKKTSSTVPKKGTKFTVKGVKYKIIKKASKGTGAVSIYGVKKKTIKSVKIAGTVSYKGAKYKITQIASKAFAKCKKLKKIKITGKNLTKVGKNALKGIHKKCVIKVPSSKLKKYKKLFKKKGQAKTVRIKK